MSQTTTTALVAETQQTAVSGRSLWRTILDALAASRQQQADREIARFIAARGGRLDDDPGRRSAGRTPQP